MPAAIFGDRFFGKRTKAWHNIGTVLDEELTATEAMRIADIAFPIEKWPVVAVNPADDTLIDTASYAVVREPTHDDPQHRVLSIVGKEWTPIQAWDLAKMLDPISEKYPVETVGALGYGEKIFMSLDAREATIAGEEHHLYYLVTDHRDGGGALQIAFTPVRVVCQNTLTVGLNQAKISVSLTHHRSINADTEWYIGIFNQMTKAKDTTIAVMDSLADVTVERDDIKKIMYSAYPQPSQPRRLKLSRGITGDDLPKDVAIRLLSDRKVWLQEWEVRRDRTDKIRAGAMELFDKFNDEFPRLANTPWAGWQAICETEDYRKGHANGFASQVFGQRAQAKARAFETARKLVTA